ncbi:hypothetical protein AGOR_G00070530 [Albula goreensis]|uniref:Coiled-coil domain-containing protein 14 n=1 Tax=Albula goreensis TaxID=1534307 RepID=A0A8T3DM11_9TELE|nr:hypothetical protein AGOR_G00070530 [Albula goreensis]
MARQERCKKQKVISSGRLNSVRGPVQKKTVFGRQQKNFDPCYSLYSTDSEDQVTTIHKGLNHCAALLNGMLQAEKAGPRPSCSKPGKSLLTKPTSKVGKSETKKKKNVKKISSINLAPKRTGGSVGIDQRMSSSCQACSGVQSQCAHSGQSPVGQPEPVPVVQCFPEASSAVHEHICSQMGLVNSQAPGSGSLPPPAPQNSTVFNCRLTTSTPAMTPQKSSHTVHSGSAQHSLGSGEPPGCDPPPGQEALMPIRLSRARSPAETNDQHVAEEPGSQNPVAFSDGALECSKGGSSDEDKMDSLDLIPVIDTSCQTSFEKHVPYAMVKDVSPIKTAKSHVRTLKNLLRELRAIVGDQADCETLISEVEQSIIMLSAMVDHTNIQAEIALELQPLRSENAQLRRRLRIVNQQLMEHERLEKEARSADCNFELDSLQSLNLSLQNQLDEMQKDMKALQKENQELQQRNGYLLQVVEDKDRQLQQIMQKIELDNTCITLGGDNTILERNCQSKQDTSEKEKSRLSLSLPQREAVDNGLQHMTRNVLSQGPLEQNGFKPGLKLTTAGDLYENQVEEASPLSPVYDSINKYLNSLEESKHTSSPRAMYCSSGNGHLSVGSRREGSRLTEENRCISKRLAFAPADVKDFSLEEGSTIYIPLKETAGTHPSGDVRKLSPLGNMSDVMSLDSSDKMQNECIEPTNAAQSFERLHISKGPLVCKPGLGDLIGDFPSKGFGMSCAYKSIGEDVIPPSNTWLPTPFEDSTKHRGRMSGVDSTLSSCDVKSVASGWSTSSWSSFNTLDEQDFRNGLAALDASIASLQRTIHSDLNR